MFEDIIFGDQIEETKGVARHRENRSGVKHLNRLSPAATFPDAGFSLALTTSGGLPFEEAGCWFTLARDGAAPTPPIFIRMELAKVEWDDVTWSYVQDWVGTIPPQPVGTMIRYRLGARITAAQEWVYADNQARTIDRATEFSFWVDGQSAPDWARKAIVYHIFMDRFYPGDGRAWLKPENLGGFFGGTIRGVIQKLDAVQSLGFNTLWLSPLFASPSHHGYDATDYYTVEPRLGTNADLKELIAAAHARGMRVILDFVANHWSHLHPTFQDALSRQDSPYHDWYTWTHWPDDYATYFTVKGLPKLNLQYGPARQYLLDCASFWLNEGVDGFRLDYANGPSHDFWVDFRRACRAARADCWMFGEVVQTAEVQASYAGRLDGTLDFLLARALRETFARGNWSLSEFEAFLRAHERYFPPTFSRPAFLDNHDMNRFLFLAGNDTARLKLAALVLFTLSAPPVVYYGTESGVTQSRPMHLNNEGVFEVARMPMKWGAEQDLDLVEFFRRLIHLRLDHPVLVDGARVVKIVDSVQGIYAYWRAADPQKYTPGDVLVVCNNSSVPRVISLPISADAPLSDLLGGQGSRAQPGMIAIELAPLSGAFIA
jgi:cyclomaltodextrinase / maltogenic alpha-amylase / neopullulanase